MKKNIASVILLLALSLTLLTACTDTDLPDPPTDPPTEPTPALSEPAPETTPPTTDSRAPDASPGEPTPIPLRHQPDLLQIIPLPNDGSFISMALLDEAAQRLYLLNNNGSALHLVNLANLRDANDLSTLDLSNYRPTDSGFVAGTGTMSLDASRQRLYLGGGPVLLIDTASLSVTPLSNLRGQLTADPSTEQLYLTPPCNCRFDICNTLLLSAETLTGTQTLFPQPADPFQAECVYETALDSANQTLFARINNGVAGPSGGAYFALFDVSPPPNTFPSPPDYLTQNISYSRPVWSPSTRQMYVTQAGRELRALQRFSLSPLSTPLVETIFGVYGSLALDEANQRLYVVEEDLLQVFDVSGENVALLSVTPLNQAARVAAFDASNQRLYLTTGNSNQPNQPPQLMVFSTSGGSLAQPSLPTGNTMSYLPKQWLISPLEAEETQFLASETTLRRTTDGGQTWQQIGAGLPGRNLTALAAALPEQLSGSQVTLWAGVSGFNGGSGLFRSTDGGQTWLPSTRGLTDLSVVDIVVSPTFSADQSIFVNTSRAGLFRSTDGGQTWFSLAEGYALPGESPRVGHLAVSPNFANDGTLFISLNTVFRSTDGGQTWQDTSLPATPLAFSPNFASDGLIVTGNGWRSTDGGFNWEPAARGLRLSDLGVQSVFFAPDGAVYQVLQQNYEAPLLLQRSVDAGQTWQTLVSGLPSGFRFTQVQSLADGNLAFLTDSDTVRVSSPEVLTWGSPTPAVNLLAIQDLLVTPAGTVLVSQSGAGIFRSVDKGVTWVETDFPARAGPSQNLWLAGSPSGTVYAALGSVFYASQDDGQTWSLLANLQPDFVFSALAVSAQGTLLGGGSFENNDLYLSRDGGTTWRLAYDNAQPTGSEIAALDFGADNAYAWVQYGGLLRADSEAQGWSLVQPNESLFVQSLAEGPNGYLWVGGLDGEVLVSVDKGASFTYVSDLLPAGRVWSSDFLFLPSETSETILLATDKGIYRSDDAGLTWANSSAGLPRATGDSSNEESYASVQVLALGDNVVYAALAQNGGVFFSLDAGQTWRDPATGEPASPLPAATPSPLAQEPTPVPVTPPTLDCPNPPAYFANLYPDQLAFLGCPVNQADAQAVTVAEQAFMRGLMFWRSDTREIYAITEGGDFLRYQDFWEEGQPEYSCPELGPSETPPTPKRGFGLVWCSNLQLRLALGNAISTEYAYEAIIQDFENGLVLETDIGSVFLLNRAQGTWFQAE